MDVDFFVVIEAIVVAVRIVDIGRRRHFVNVGQAIAIQIFFAIRDAIAIGICLHRIVARQCKFHCVADAVTVEVAGSLQNTEADSVSHYYIGLICFLHLQVDQHVLTIAEPGAGVDRRRYLQRIGCESGIGYHCSGPLGRIGHTRIRNLAQQDIACPGRRAVALRQYQVKTEWRTFQNIGIRGHRQCRFRRTERQILHQHRIVGRCTPQAGSRCGQRMATTPGQRLLRREYQVLLAVDGFQTELSLHRHIVEADHCFRFVAIDIHSNRLTQLQYDWRDEAVGHFWHADANDGRLAFLEVQLQRLGDGHSSDYRRVGLLADLNGFHINIGNGKFTVTLRHRDIGASAGLIEDGLAIHRHRQLQIGVLQCAVQIPLPYPVVVLVDQCGGHGNGFTGFQAIGLTIEMIGPGYFDQADLDRIVRRHRQRNRIGCSGHNRILGRHISGRDIGKTCRHRDLGAIGVGGSGRDQCHGGFATVHLDQRLFATGRQSIDRDAIAKSEMESGIGQTDPDGRQRIRCHQVACQVTCAELQLDLFTGLDRCDMFDPDLAWCTYIHPDSARGGNFRIANQLCSQRVQACALQTAHIQRRETYCVGRHGTQADTDRISGFHRLQRPFDALRRYESTRAVQHGHLIHRRLAYAECHRIVGRLRIQFMETQFVGLLGQVD